MPQIVILIFNVKECYIVVRKVFGVLVCLVITLSIFSVSAYACDDCRNDSRAFGISHTGIVQNVKEALGLYPCHNYSYLPGGQVYNGESGATTHAYPATGSAISWVRIEMTSGNAAGLNGWLPKSYVRIPSLGI